jgi:predicted transcriptional regulator
MAENEIVGGQQQEVTLAAIVSLLDGEVISPTENLGQVVTGGAAADLMSDVLAYAQPGCLLLTGLVNPQAVRTAEMSGIEVIVFVRGKQPPDETLRVAEETGIQLLRTRYTMFEACGLLFRAGLKGLGPCDDYTSPERAGA